MSFSEKYTEFDEGSIRLYISESSKEDMETEIFANVSLTGYPLRDYKAMWSDMNNIIKDYNKINNRNRKKDDGKLNKHAMHLVRLYLMCFDILEKEEIITFRENDHDLLMSIRGGAFQHEDGTYSDDFFGMIDEYDKRLEYAKGNTTLPAKPDYRLIEEWVMSVNRRSI
jgi:hypothetical protein